jgi:hypothetical protein
MEGTIILSEKIINQLINKREFIFGELHRKTKTVGINLIKNWVN